MENNDLPEDFNYKAYCRYNKDLEGLTEEEAIYHFKNYGKKEYRPYSILPPDFDFKVYLELNRDVDCSDEQTAIDHFIKYGFYEGRPYKKNESVELKKKKYLYNQKILEQFCKIYEVDSDKIDSDNKIKFRYLCYFYLDYIRQFNIPKLKQNLPYEAVLVEFRAFPHIEFILRNNILKLGEEWSITIICGNMNYNFVSNLAKKISPMIKIIKTDYNNVIPSEYSLYLTKKEFWTQLKGSKILIFQEDSIIFRNNIDKFLYYDYIGAPWPLDNNSNKSRVGNGGFSLRTKRIMEKIIDSIEMNETLLNTHTIEYMKRTNSFITPEDVYFSKNMEDLKIGRLAPFSIAKMFAQESIISENCLGGHNFWLCDSSWERKLAKNNVVQFRPRFDMEALEHRGGWKSILLELEKCHFYSDSSYIDFYDMMEPYFLWKNDFLAPNKWIGIIHCTPKTPSYLNELNIDNLFKNNNFLNSLKKCIFLFTLSPYLTNYLKKKINIDLELSIPIYTIFHPVETSNIPLFDINKYLENKNKYLIQIGQQLRKVTTIYNIDIPSHKKIWLTGCKDFKKMERLLDQESTYFNLNASELDSSVEMKYTKTYNEFDELLSKNIVIANFFDAAANNTILECIVRNTPIFVNKIEGVIDYLGEDYPLYFDSIEEIPSLLDSKKIKEAYLYLKKLDKKKFSIDSFIKSLFALVYKHFLIT